MNKRKFIRMFGAVMASPALSPLVGWAMADKLKKWAGNL
jgi:hypothetical protein